MRPVNLIPPEDRRGDHAPLRAGSLSYVVVGAIAAALVAVVALVLTQNSITEKENEVAQLEVARDAAAQRAQALAPYAEFASLQEQREMTITSLAESRFDWERVLRELALVIPEGVSLSQLKAQAVGEGGEGTAAANLGSSPSLAMGGCASDHDTVAAFVAALEDIDGVTRVGLENSAVTNEDGDAAATSSSIEGNFECEKRDKPTAFALTAAFDAATPVDPAAASTPPAAPAATPAGGTNSTQEQIEESEQAANLVPGAAR